MARTWRTERTTAKQPRKDTPRPRVSEFSRDYYHAVGYTVDDTVTAPEAHEEQVQSEGVE